MLINTNTNTNTRLLPQLLNGHDSKPDTPA